MTNEEITKEGRDLLQGIAPEPWDASRASDLGRVMNNDKGTLVAMVGDFDWTVRQRTAAFIARSPVLLRAALDALEEATMDIARKRAEVERLGKECTRLGEIVKGASEQTKEAFHEAERSGWFLRHAQARVKALEIVDRIEELDRAASEAALRGGK